MSLAGARKAYGDTQVLHGIDLTTRDGEFLVLVGPSGCGKSTLLRAIAGLETLDGGDVAIDGVRMTDAAPSARGIAMVFQNYALYPHMTVAQNMGFALKLAKLPRAAVGAAVRRAAETLDIAHLLDRKPAALSGGQRQRVAIGRAIVREPKVFLFDEPLSNLDAGLRARMRYEFAALHRTLGTTMIYVTHDQAEAMTLADRIVVLRAGRVEQIGRPLELYEAPANLFVAGFIGSPGMNFLRGTLVSAAAAGHAVVDVGGVEIVAAVDAMDGRAGDAVTVGIRPERIAGGSGDAALSARVRFVEALGNASFVHLERDGDTAPLIRQVSGAATECVGDTVSIVLPPRHLHLFGPDGRAFPRTAVSDVQAA